MGAAVNDCVQDSSSATIHPPQQQHSKLRRGHGVCATGRTSRNLCRALNIPPLRDRFLGDIDAETDRRRWLSARYTRCKDGRWCRWKPGRRARWVGSDGPRGDPRKWRWEEIRVAPADEVPVVTRRWPAGRCAAAEVTLALVVRLPMNPPLRYSGEGHARVGLQWPEILRCAIAHSGATTG